MPESIQDYFVREKETEQGLPPGDAFALISIPSNELKGHTAGRVCWMNRKLAAKYIAQAYFRLATEAEIGEWHRDQAQRREEILSEEHTKTPGLILPHILAGMKK